MSYQEEYQAYLMAQREMRQYRQDREELGGRLAAAEQDEREIGIVCDDYARERKSLENQKGRVRDEIRNEKEKMTERIQPEARVSRPVLENFRSMQDIRETEPERYQAYMDTVRGILGRAGTGTQNENSGKEGPEDEITEAKVQAGDPAKKEQNSKVSVEEFENAREVLRELNSQHLASRGMGSMNDLDHAQKRLEVLKAEREEREMSQMASVHLSVKLTSGKAGEKYRPDAVGIMEETLNQLIQTAPAAGELGGVRSLEDFFAEGEAIEKEQEEYRQLADQMKDFSFKNYFSMKPDQHEKMRGVLNSLIRQYQPKEGAEKPVNSVEEYVNSLGMERQLENVLKAAKDRKDSGIPDEMLQEKGIWAGDPVMSEHLKNYEEARDNRAKQEASVLNLPGTFTELRKLEKNDPVLYQATVNRINEVIAGKVSEASQTSGKTDIFADSLETYFQMEKASSSGTVKTMDDTKAAAAKAQIKGWIKEYNQAASKRSRKENHDLKQALAQAKEREEQAGKILVNAVKDKREDLEKLKTANEAKKKFIKEQVIPGALEGKRERVEELGEAHESHKKILDKLVKDYNKEHEREARRLDKNKGPQKGSEERFLLDVVNRTEQVLEEDKGSNLRKNVKSVLEYQTKGLEDAVNQENARNEKLKKSANDDINQYRKDELSGCRSNYVKSAVEKKVLGFAARTVTELNQQFCKLLLITTEAALRGEVEGIQRQAQEVNESRERSDRLLAYSAMAGARLDENLRQQADGTRPARTQIDLSRLVEGEQQRAEIERHAEELAARQVELSDQLNEKQQEMLDRILQNRAEIDDSFREQPVYDGESQRRIDELKDQIESGVAGEDPQQKELAKIRAEERRKKIDRLIMEDKQAARQLEERTAMIQEGSEKLKGLFTEKSLSRIDTLVKFGQGVVNFINSHMDSASGNKAAGDPLDVQEKLTALKESLQNKDEKEHIVTQVLEIGKLLHGKISAASKQLQEQYQDASYNAFVGKGLYEGMQDQENDFHEFSESEEMKDKNRLEQWLSFYDKSSGILEKKYDADIESVQKKEDTAKSLRENAAAKAASSREELAAKDEAITMQKEHLSAQKRQMRAAFSETVRNSAQRQDGALAEADIVKGDFEKDGLSFLSALTNTDMSGGADLDKAMEAFGRIHINGINAVSYFGLAERWQNASFGDSSRPENSEARSQLMQELAERGNDLRDALKSSFGLQAGQETAGGMAQALAGQIIAVENPETLLLSAVQLTPGQNEGALSVSAAAYNKTVKEMTESLNQARCAAAQEKVPESKSKRAELTAGQKLAKAVHRSRDITKDFKQKERKAMSR